MSEQSLESLVDALAEKVGQEAKQRFIAEAHSKLKHVIAATSITEQTDRSCDVDAIKEFLDKRQKEREANPKKEPWYSKL